MLCINLYCMKEYFELRKVLETSLREGFITMAEVRHSVGRSRMGMQQIPTQMRASRRIKSMMFHLY